MRSPTVMRLEARRLEKALEVVERGLGAHDWLLPSGFSAVDCAVGYGAMIGRRFVGFEGLPRVAGWLRRCEARAAFGRAAARDGAAEIYRQDFYAAPEG
jgi:glutathione S-transferase